MAKILLIDVIVLVHVMTVQLRFIRTGCLDGLTQEAIDKAIKSARDCKNSHEAIEGNWTETRFTSAQLFKKRLFHGTVVREEDEKSKKGTRGSVKLMFFNDRTIEFCTKNGRFEHCMHFRRRKLARTSSDREIPN